MTVGIKAISEYNRQYKWHDVGTDKVAGCPSYLEHNAAEPPLQGRQKPTLELAAKEVVQEKSTTFGSPSKDLHVTREPSFLQKKRVPGSSPERIKVDKSLAKKAGLPTTTNTARYQSEYSSNFSPKKSSKIAVPSALQSAKSMFIDSNTNLPIGKKPVDKKVESEYNARYADPTAELRHIRQIYKEQIRRKQLELDKLEDAKKPAVEEPTEKKQEEAEEEEYKSNKEEVKNEPEKKLKLKIVSPLKGDKPKVKATYDLITPQKPTKICWKSEYKSKFEGPDKEKPWTPSAYGRRAHPYRHMSPEKVADLIKPDGSEIDAKKSSLNTVGWYSDVLELRRLAQQFKAKSHGSHFSPNKMLQLAYSSAQLRDVTQPTIDTAASEESVRIIPRVRRLIGGETRPVVAELEPETAEIKPETDLVVTDLEECPNINNLVLKRSVKYPPASPTPAPVKTAPVKTVPVKTAPVKTVSMEPVFPAASKKAMSPDSTPRTAASTPRTADRSFNLFGDRVPTPRLKNAGSRHHFDRTTKIINDKICSVVGESNALLAGRCDTPRLHELGGSRHHLDSTTPAPAPPALATQPFVPILCDEVQEKLDFSSPDKNGAARIPAPAVRATPAPAKNGWTKDLDYTVLSRASSCTSLASETLNKAKQRGTDFWR